MQSQVLYTDADLLEQIATGDEKAFNLLFERYQNRLYSYMIKATKSKETAEEATLDVFLRIWNARDILHEILNFEAFLFRIVHNRALDYVRKAKNNPVVQQEIWAEIEKLAAADTADQKILSAENESALHHAVGQLPAQQKEVFRLSREEYLSYDEIAARMKISKHTVRNHMSAALHFIRAHLKNGHEIATILVLTSKIYS